MAVTLQRRWLCAAAAACVLWAGFEARGIAWSALGAGAAPVAAPEPAAVAACYADIREAIAAARVDEALLQLAQRAAKGPYPGYARFLQGELAYAEGAYSAAVEHYRAAVESDPSVGDRNAALAAGLTIEGRLRDLLEGPWAADRPPQIRDLYYLKRRLAGGCE